jgi:hypothetical protein
MKTKTFTAMYIVTRVRSEGYTVKTWLERARKAVFIKEMWGASE